MFRVFLFILLCITIAYWIGYHVGKSESDYRPVCFLTYGEQNPDTKLNVTEIYWGYFDMPYSNRKTLSLYGMKFDERDVFFLIEKDALIEDANGQTVTATINIGKFSQRKNPYYLANLFRHGAKIVLVEIGRASCRERV